MDVEIRLLLTSKVAVALGAKMINSVVDDISVTM